MDFVFDQVVAADVDTETLFSDHLLGLVKQCGDGFNSTVFAYGQTGSGKTYTMRGDNENPGIIAAVARELFTVVKEQVQHRVYFIRLSYMEVGHYHMTCR